MISIIINIILECLDRRTAKDARRSQTRQCSITFEPSCSSNGNHYQTLIVTHQLIDYPHHSNRGDDIISIIRICYFSRLPYPPHALYYALFLYLSLYLYLCLSLSIYIIYLSIYMIRLKDLRKNLTIAKEPWNW